MKHNNETFHKTSGGRTRKYGLRELGKPFFRSCLYTQQSH